MYWSIINELDINLKKNFLHAPVLLNMLNIKSCDSLRLKQTDLHNVTINQSELHIQCLSLISELRLNLDF